MMNPWVHLITHLIGQLSNREFEENLWRLTVPGRLLAGQKSAPPPLVAAELPRICVDGWSVGWWCGRMVGPGVFVGREGELSRLQAALGERVRLVLVVGDAGIGKSRFVAEGLAGAT
jgi:AAA ATPase domain